MLPFGSPSIYLWGAASLFDRRQGLRFWWSLGLGHCEEFLGHSERTSLKPIQRMAAVRKVGMAAVTPLNYPARETRSCFHFLLQV